MPRAGAFEFGRLSERHHGFEVGVDVVPQPEVQPVLHPLEFGAGKALVGKDDQARGEQRLALGEVGHDFAAPAEIAVGAEHEFLVGRAAEPFGAFGDFRGDDLRSGGAQPLGIAFFGSRQREAEPFDGTDQMTFEADFAAVVHFRRYHMLVSQMAHQHAGAPVHKSLR
jgi:hypothetical protein